MRLRPVRESDLPHYQGWLADDELRRWIGSVTEQPTIEEEFDWYVSRRQDPDSVLWAIETTEGTLLGNVELRMSVNNLRGEVGIAIFDREYWGQGYGTEALKLVLEYAFGELELNRVELTTDHDNTRAIRSYEKCGFTQEGVLRKHRMIDGVPSDSLILSILREEWQVR
ncbi:MAG TPA: GNAT family protein [Dehalococcoidia bacterium]|nr:GNAT family protein [Dehalococcoidia bacterium]